MSDKTVRVQLVPSVPVLLFLTFLVLKLTGYIGWSWVWVTAPLWLSFGLGVGLLFFVFFVALIFAFINGR